MSYILEALVQADQERQRQQVPGLCTLQDRSSPPLRFPPGPSGRPWPLLLAGAVLGAGGLFLSRSLPPPLPAPALFPAAASLPAAARLSPAVAPEAAALASRREKRREPVRQPVRLNPPTAEKAPLRPGSRLYRIDELPADLQAEARKISVAGFARAPGAGEALAIINDRAWREGDEVKEGLKVENISTDGVVFNLKGYRFRKGGA